jgi:hypothetical protein
MGRKGLRLRSAKPDQGTILGRRAAYVWRWARFHGGADVTMPCTVDNAGDPWGKDLDVIADRVARHVFGTDMAAAHRWGTALGLTSSAPAGLPASAYAGGPEHDGADADTIAMLACQRGEV